MLFASKVVKSDSKIIILLCYSKTVKHSVRNRRIVIRFDKGNSVKTLLFREKPHAAATKKPNHSTEM